MASEPDPLQERARSADKIIRNPAKYKICMGCDSIVASEVATCPNCHAYRFEEDSERVVAQARLLGSREKRTVLPSDFE